MSHKDYRNYSKQFSRDNTQEQVMPVTSAVTPVEQESEPVLDATVPEPEVTTEPDVVDYVAELPKAVTGVVSGCKKLNVRNRPTTTAAIITVVEEGTEVEIVQPVLDGEFYKVTLANGTIGYCMKKFISVK